MEILIVEDDDFKANDINRTIEDHFPGVPVAKAASVTSALRAINSQDFEFVLLDMSLPTFDLSGPGGGGSPQSQGGVEVLRLARRLDREACFIVITQYPDIEIDGRQYALEDAAAQLSERFHVKVAACIAYQFDQDDWKGVLNAALSTELD